MEALAISRVAVFGIGGVGSFAAEAIARAGVGAIDVFDDDKVCLTNINRQLIALHSTIGKPKVEVNVAMSKDLPIFPLSDAVNNMVVIDAIFQSLADGGATVAIKAKSNPSN